MGKKTNKKDGRSAPGPNPQQKAIFARLNFLYQAAMHLTTHSAQAHLPPPHSSPESRRYDEEVTAAATSIPTSVSSPSYAQAPVSHHLVQTLLSTARKTVTRLDRSVKRTICKRCSAILIPGVSSSTWVVNDSKGGKKPRADVVVAKCDCCGAEKRFPVQRETLQLEGKPVAKGGVSKPRGRKGKSQKR